MGRFKCVGFWFFGKFQKSRRNRTEASSEPRQTSKIESFDYFRKMLHLRCWQCFGKRFRRPKVGFFFRKFRDRYVSQYDRLSVRNTKACSCAIFYQGIFWLGSNDFLLIVPRKKDVLFLHQLFVIRVMHLYWIFVLLSKAFPKTQARVAMACFSLW